MRTPFFIFKNQKCIYSKRVGTQKTKNTQTNAYFSNMKQDSGGEVRKRVF